MRWSVKVGVNDDPTSEAEFEYRHNTETVYEGEEQDYRKRLVNTIDQMLEANADVIEAGSWYKIEIIP